MLTVSGGRTVKTVSIYGDRAVQTTLFPAHHTPAVIPPTAPVVGATDGQTAEQIARRVSEAVKFSDLLRDRLAGRFAAKRDSVLRAFHSRRARAIESGDGSVLAMSANAPGTTGPHGRQDLKHAIWLTLAIFGPQLNGLGTMAFLHDAFPELTPRQFRDVVNSYDHRWGDERCVFAVRDGFCYPSPRVFSGSGDKATMRHLATVFETLYGDRTALCHMQGTDFLYAASVIFAAAAQYK